MKLIFCLYKMNRDYVVCIPSYKRATVCNDKTLSTLHKHKIDLNKIYVYVANKKEYDLYKSVLNPNIYNKLVIGEKGLVPQRQFIMEQWSPSKRIVFLDDDVERIDMSLSSMYKGHTLDYFIKDAFNKCIMNNAFIWGVYPVFNPFFRKTKTEMSTELKYIVGAFYGIINRPTLKEIKLTLTKLNGQKEDVERSIKYFVHDGIVLRFNKIGFITKYYGKEGGLGRFEERLKPMEAACKTLEYKYSEYGHTRVRRNGMSEFVLKKKPANTVSHKKLKTSKQKTKKIRKNGLV